MTRLEFKKALKKGRGLCVQALKDGDALNRFREIVLWACSKDLSLDAQSEGTRARFLADIVGCYTDKMPFIKICERTILRNLRCRDWVFQQSCELLGLLASEGVDGAYAALLRSFGEFVRHETKQTDVALPIQAKENAMSLLTELIPLCHLKSDQDLVVRGIGSLFPLGSGFDAEFRQELLELANRSSALFVKECLENEKLPRHVCDDSLFEGAKQESVKLHLTRFRLLKLKRAGCLDEVRNYVRMCVAESNQRVQVASLEAFADSALIEFLPRAFVKKLLDSCHSKTVAVGRRLMAKMRSGSALKLGRKLLQEDVAFDDAIEMVARNCKKQDERLLLSAIRKAERFGRCRRHSIHHAVICALEDSGCVVHQRRVLEVLADSVECSCCRERCVRVLDSIGCLPHSMLEECGFGAGESLREFARALLRSRRSGNGHETGSKEERRRHG